MSRYYVDGPVPRRNNTLVGSLSAASRKARKVSIDKGYAAVRTSILDGYRVVMQFRHGTKVETDTSSK